LRRSNLLLLSFFFTLVTGPRRSSSLQLSDKRVYEPQIRARLGTTAHCAVPTLTRSLTSFVLQLWIRVADTHPGGNPGANLKSISHRCHRHLFEVAFVWELIKETIHPALGCLQDLPWILTHLATLKQALAREFFIDNLLVRIHFIIVMIRWTGLAPWEFEFPFPGSLTSTLL